VDHVGASVPPRLLTVLRFFQQESSHSRFYEKRVGEDRSAEDGASQLLSSDARNGCESASERGIYAAQRNLTDRVPPRVMRVHGRLNPADCFAHHVVAHAEMQIKQLSILSVFYLASGSGF
jgi:hypothetical protein